MTKEEMMQIAQMTASILKSSESPQDALRAPIGGKTLPTIVSRDSEASKAIAAPQTLHKPALSSKQVEDVLNDCRMEVRIQNKYPLIVALENALKEYGLITPELMCNIVTALKENGQYWPHPVISILNEDGVRIYMNTNYQLEDGSKWKRGKEVVFKS